MCLTLPPKNVALASNSSTGWTGNLIAVPAVNSPHTKYRLWCQLFPFEKTSYRILHCIQILQRMPQGGLKRFHRDDLPFVEDGCFVDRKPPGFWIGTRVARFPWHTAEKLLRTALK